MRVKTDLKQTVRYCSNKNVFISDQQVPFRVCHTVSHMQVSNKEKITLLKK